MSDIFMLDVLLERAQSHPEEFGASGKWVRIIDHYDDCMTEEEKKKVIDALYKARRARFNEALMKALANEDNPTTEDTSFTFRSKDRYAFDSSLISNGANVTLNSNFTASSFSDSMKQELVKEIKRLQEEKEMDAMHNYYKEIGKAE